MRFVFFFLLASAALAAETHLPQSQLVVLDRAVCLLGYPDDVPTKTAVDCWPLAFDQIEEKLEGFQHHFRLPLTHPTQIVNSHSRLCALDGENLRCFAIAGKFPDVLAEEKSVAAPAAEPVILSADPWQSSLICSADREGKAECGGKALDTKDRVALETPNALSVGDQLACFLTAEKKLRCFGQDDAGKECGKLLEEATPSDLVNPADLTLRTRRADQDTYDSKRGTWLRDCYACVLESGALRCWGRAWYQVSASTGPVHFPIKESIPGLRAQSRTVNGAAVDRPLFSAEPDRLIPFLDRALNLGTVLSNGVLENFWIAVSTDTRVDGESTVYTDTPYLKRHLLKSPVDHPVLFSRWYNDYCLADGHRLTCADYDGRGVLTTDHHQLLNQAGLQNLTSDLEFLVPRLYARPAKVVAAAASLAATASDPGRLFLINAIAPVLESETSTFFETNVLPAFRTLRETYDARYGYRALRDIDESTRIPLALALLKTALPLLRESGLDTVDALVALGNALSAPGDLATRKTLAAKGDALQSTLHQAPESIHGLAEMVSLVFQAL